MFQLKDISKYEKYRAVKSSYMLPSNVSREEKWMQKTLKEEGTRAKEIILAKKSLKKAQHNIGISMKAQQLKDVL
jgi:hypothetical protein